jgi:hypothetical protein
MFREPKKSAIELNQELQIEINKYKYKSNPLVWRKSDEEKNLLKELKKSSNKTFTQHFILN